MYAQASAKIDLPSYLPHQSPAPAFEGPATPVSFFTAGAEIYAQGEKAGALYQVEFGAVRIYRMLADGRRQISAFHLAGETFGFEADVTHHFFAEAINATGVRVFRAPSGTDMSR
ncbi:MAG: cyclic nucleotide-binding domain-containing protein, partial [Mesorhizobium sp.]